MLHLLIVLALVAVHGADGNGIFNPGETYPPINPTLFLGNATGLYNSKIEKCCLGNISPANNLAKCCGNRSYNPSKEICCADQVNPLIPGHACCGTGTYDTDTEICCDSYTLKTSDANKPNILCCGNQTYNFNTQLCCYSSNAVSKNVVVDIKDNITGCCNGKAMDYRTQMCCIDAYEGAPSANLFTRKYEHSSCCGNKLIDSNIQGCCNHTIYNVSEQVCCPAQTFQLIPVNKPGEMCCTEALKSFDPKTHICCRSNIIERTSDYDLCCNDKAYNSQKETCCFDTFNILKGAGLCCGDKLYDVRADETCCESRNGQNTVYKRKASTCCNGKVYDGQGICCTDQEGNGEFQMQTNYGTYACCGSKPFQPQSQLCCGNTIGNISNNGLKCCGDKIYNVKSQICCPSYDSTKFEVYDAKPNSVCCGTNLISNQNGAVSCCGENQYDSKKQTCCGNKLLDNDSSKNTCCYEFMTDAYTLFIEMPNR